MSKLYFFLICIAIFSSCARIAYIGNETSPTTSVDIFIEEKAIEKPYTVLGKGFLHNQVGPTSPEKMQRMAVLKAKEKGADAILISDYTIANVDAGVRTISTTDTVKQSLITMGQQIEGSTHEFVIYFIKYNR